MQNLVFFLFSTHQIQFPSRCVHGTLFVIHAAHIIQRRQVVCKRKSHDTNELLKVCASAIPKNQHLKSRKFNQNRLQFLRFKTTFSWNTTSRGLRLGTTMFKHTKVVNAWSAKIAVTMVIVLMFFWLIALGNSWLMILLYVERLTLCYASGW